MMIIPSEILPVKIGPATGAYNIVAGRGCGNPAAGHISMRTFARPLRRLSLALLLAASLAPLQPGQPVAGASAVPPRRVLLPMIGREMGCPDMGTPQSYSLVTIDGSYYKDNRLSDLNPDFRLDVLGYSPVSAPLQLVSYNPGVPDAHTIHARGMFSPERVPAFVSAYKRHDWTWNESGPAPYGARGGVNNDWPVSALALATTRGETLAIPRRDVVIWGANEVALVLYADDNQMAVTYTRLDSVAVGYVVYLTGLCVDPGLVSAYRAQLDGSGRRNTGKLPGVRNGQSVGRARANSVNLAIRDSAMFMDPRSSTDWWAP